MPRIAMPSENEMSPEQRAVRDETISGIRGSIPPPLIAWIRNPEMAQRGQRLGELLRYQTSLGPKLSELAILVCGRHWTSHAEWTIHKREALKAGLDPQIIADIAARKTPTFTDEKQKVVYEISSVLLSTSRLPKALYDQGSRLIGEKGLAELVAVLGYYCLCALTLNAFELGLPESLAPELEDPDFR